MNTDKDKIAHNGHSFNAYLSDSDLQEANEIADLITEGNLPMAQENFSQWAEKHDAMQIIAFRDAIKLECEVKG